MQLNFTKIVIYALQIYVFYEKNNAFLRKMQKIFVFLIIFSYICAPKKTFFR